MKNALVNFAIMLVLTSLFVSCKTTCIELKEKLKDKIVEIKRKCECDFTVQCDKNFSGAGVVGLTITGPDGKPLIKLPGGEKKVELSTLKHELIHAIDKCIRFSESKFPTPQNLVGTRAEYIFIIRRRLLAEYIAYSCLGVYEDLSIDKGRFPNPDDNDRAMLSAYGSLASSVVSTLTPELRKELLKTLEAANLSPQQIGTSNGAYNELKRTTMQEAQNFKTQMKDCLDFVLAINSKK